MKIPKDKNRKLNSVAKNHRVFIYDASIMIEFLETTFLTLYELCERDQYLAIGPGARIEKEILIDDSIVKAYTTRELYEMYMTFRNAKDYTAEIESFYKFVLLLKKMTLPKNGWQFNVLRFGRAQIVNVWPLALRLNVKPPVADPLKDQEIENAETAIEAAPEDYDMPDKEFVEEQMSDPVAEITAFERDFGAKTIAEAFPKKEAVESPPQTNSSVPEEPVKPLPIVDPGLTDQY